MKAIKTIGCALLSLLTAGLLLTGCRGQQEVTEVTIDVVALADALKAAVPFEDELAEPSEAAVSNIYDLDDADVAAKKIYVGSGATAEEIAVFEGTDEAAAGRIRAAVDQRIADQRSAFEDYNPEEQEKLSDPVVVTAGRYVILCVSNDNDAAEKCIDEYTGG
ncbi:MAG TPA: DUF4358 domain-containing protein [Firmicutes bacterium]|nr:DUF4358 domain-containing protein [Bacillota bacterium]